MCKKKRSIVTGQVKNNQIKKVISTPTVFRAHHQAAMELEMKSFVPIQRWDALITETLNIFTSQIHQRCIN